VREGARGITALATLLTVVSLALTIPYGSRIFLLPLIGGTFAFVYLHRRARPSVALVAGLAVLALFASFAAGVLRNPERRPDARDELTRALERPTTILEPIFRGNDAEMAAVLAGALTAIPERLDFRHGGAVVGNLVTRPIPRQLWPGKPEPPGETVVSTVWPHLDGVFHPAFTPLLNFYWDFGVPGVLVGMAFFGLACRTLYAWFCAYRDSFAAQLTFGATIWYVVIAARNDPVDTVVFASFFVLPLLVLARLPLVRRPRARPVLERSRPVRGDG
jgi:hypothetical protein